jgi:putative Ca2+/H+ antiporter (TMEM165/GDT1 family)
MIYPTAVFGWVVTIVPRIYTHYISVALFVLFGLKMLKEGYYMSPNEGQEEFEEVQSDLRKREDEVNGRDKNKINDVHTHTKTYILKYMCILMGVIAVCVSWAS